MQSVRTQKITASLPSIPASNQQSQTLSESSGSGDSRGSEYSNSAPASAIPSCASVPSEALVWSSSLSDSFNTSRINASKRLVWPEDKYTCKSRNLPSSFHFSNNENASVDETMFMGIAETCGPKIAIFLASDFHWDCQRPLAELQAFLAKNG